MWRLVADRADQRTFTGWAGVVCQVVAEQVGVDATSIAVRSSTHTEELVAVSGPWAGQLEELQYTAGEGPGVDAYQSGVPVLVPDLAAAGHRWPGFAELTAGRVGAVFAFPLREGAAPLGTLELYRRRRGPLSLDQLADAAALADLAATALVVDTGDGVAESAPWARADAPGHYDDVNVATGMLAAELDIDVEDAFLRLRAHAFSHDQPLLEVARAVLGRRLGAEAFRD
ncbi:hypothetical protein BU204_17400 [Actinophytocola xanthii]|uniref:ANTAR domain-containing protein n=1 Tax=Actinophytocola xanthii TaxID=1912961 RepID=A0A1Q8CPT6_9PSEU|nr:hypothetical protein BU204_17400 [Actinophytocola xanthii]